jgi:DNA-binding GntR family transcriptional regulator
MQQRGVPLYLKVAATIKSRIHSGIYQRGEWIPAAKDLALEFGVSTITIRKAVERLIQEGYLAARQGAGTRVTHPELKKVEIQISGDFREWFDSASGRSPRLAIQLLDIAGVPPPKASAPSWAPTRAPAASPWARCRDPARRCSSSAATRRQRRKT